MSETPFPWTHLDCSLFFSIELRSAFFIEKDSVMIFFVILLLTMSTFLYFLTSLMDPGFIQQEDVEVCSLIIIN